MAWTVRWCGANCPSLSDQPRALATPKRFNWSQLVANWRKRGGEEQSVSKAVAASPRKLLNLNLLQVTNPGDGLENKSFDILLEFEIDGESAAVALILLKSLEDCDVFDIFANVEWGNGCVPGTQEDSPSLVR